MTPVRGLVTELTKKFEWRHWKYHRDVSWLRSQPATSWREYVRAQVEQEAREAERARAEDEYWRDFALRARNGQIGSGMEFRG